MIGKICRLDNTWGKYLIKPISIDGTYIEAHFATKPYNMGVWTNHGIGAFLLSETNIVRVLKNPSKKILKVFP